MQPITCTIYQNARGCNPLAEAECSFNQDESSPLLKLPEFFLVDCRPAIAKNAVNHSAFNIKNATGLIKQIGSVFQQANHGHNSLESQKTSIGTCQGATPSLFMIAACGAIGGIFDGLVANTGRLVRDRIQLDPKKRPLSYHLQHFTPAEALQGAAAYALGNALASAVCYFVKTAVKQKIDQHRLPWSETQKAILAGMAAGCIEPCFTQPLRQLLVKQQVTNRSLWYNAQQICSKQGPAALWLGLRTTMIRNIIGMGVFFGAASFFQQFIDKKQQKNPTYQLLIGLCAATCSSQSTLPFDRVITLTYAERLQGRCLWSTALHIAKTEGIAGFYRGNFANMLRVIPGTTVGFLVTNSLLYWLNQHYNKAASIQQQQAAKQPFPCSSPILPAYTKKDLPEKPAISSYRRYPLRQALLPRCHQLRTVRKKS